MRTIDGDFAVLRHEPCGEPMKSRKEGGLHDLGEAWAGIYLSVIVEPDNPEI